MSATTLHVGISPCPNDTFAFAGLIEGAVRVEGAALRLEFADVEELNQRLARGEFDAAKGSFHAALRMSDALSVLSAGAALGRGVGPLLLARRNAPAIAASTRVLCPGEWTTASLLFQLFHGSRAVEQTLFSRIMPELAAGRADHGVCIHEGRFTWRDQGLECVEDLGERWEKRFDCALPLGGILIRRSRAPEFAPRLAAAIEDSIRWSRAHPQHALAVMRRHAQELSEAVIRAHVDLYVNDDTLCLGAQARAALGVLAREAAKCGVAVEGPAPLDVVGRSAGRRLFHAASVSDVAQLDLRGSWSPPSLAAEGFVHLSFATQLAGSLARHFAAAGEVDLLELDPERCRASLREDPSRDGALFPHLYRAVESADVLRRWRLARDHTGAWAVPADLER